MSADRGITRANTASRPAHVRPGHFVIVGGDHVDQGDWWMGQVLDQEASALNHKAFVLLQVVDVDTGVIRWINAEEVADVIWSMDGWPSMTPDGGFSFN